jgi:hypothetical protein
MVNMSISVKLSAIIDGMELQSDENSSYLNKHTGEVVTITDEELRAAEEANSLEEYPEWQQEIIEKARDIIADDNEEQYIALPSRFDIHEYNIMEKFCLSIKEKEISNSLYQALKGKGAFRRFKDAIQRYGVAEDWYKYRDDTIKRLAIEWCEARGIQYTED